MAQTVGFGHLPSLHGGRGVMVAMGTVASVVDGGSFAVQLQTGGSTNMSNILTAIVTVQNQIYGSAIVAYAKPTSSGSNGYVTVSLWYAGSQIPSVRAGTVDLNFLVFGGGGSI